MSSLEDIESAIKHLSTADLSQFRTWFAEFDSERWDRQFEKDVTSGRLDNLADEALDDLRNGHCTDL